MMENAAKTPENECTDAPAGSPPLLEVRLREHLEKALGLPVLFERPAVLPASFVLAERLGGGEETGLYTARMALQSYAGSLFDAMLLNERVKQAMTGFAAREDVCRVGLEGDYNFTDPETKRYRYQAVYEIVFY